ncbi:MAG: hypothetical protein CMP59_07360 [Flavobacteriales bacterium]|nr:hypothetical protein [Flavobacteriales bacterium]|tara:strand:- start:198 stop:737 length:540 start_codon:yes stop_codon:yes gene_type:complete
MRYVLLVLFVTTLSFSLKSQEVIAVESIKVKGVRLILVIEADKDTTLTIRIRNRRLSPIYFDTTFFDVSMYSNDSYRLVYGQGSDVQSILPMQLLKLKKLDLFETTIEIPKGNLDMALIGEIHFLTPSDLRELELNKSLESKLPIYSGENIDTRLLKFKATIISFDGLKPEIKWSGRNW